MGITKEQQFKKKSVDSKNYVKYILREGTTYDKRDLLSCLKSKLVLKDKKLQLQS